MVALRDIEAFANRIAETYRPQRIVLFGSHATGSARPDSDVDLLIVMPDDGDPLSTAARICRQIPAEFPVDVIVRNPEDLQWRLSQRDWFLLNIMKNGKVLHAAPDG